MPTRTSHLAATALALAVLAFAACGDDDESSNGSGGSENAGDSGGGGYGSRDNTDGQNASGGGGKATVLALSADPGGDLKFDKSSLTAKAGDVTIVLRNPSSATAPHAVEIEGHGVEEESDTIDPGGTSKVSAKLEPGEYEFYCPVDDHKGAGMEGTLTVN
ncbi:MAG TPA: plastocyanin/azurin family copper-binding protein [Thermoleophilaceae bacterium]|jgi:plastocyanin